MEPGHPTPDGPDDNRSRGTPHPSMDGQWRLTRHAIEQAGLNVNTVWMRYFSFSGEAGEYEIDAYLNGSLSLPVLDADLISHAVNELIDELPPLPRAPYSTTRHGEEQYAEKPDNE